MTQPLSLEERLAALESAVRSLMATNWTDRASVVDASGNVVPLSSLAFGQVAAIKAGLGVEHVGGVQNHPKADQTNPAVWTYDDPTVTVLVKGGRLRVDWSSLMSLNGGNPSTTFAAYWAYSYRVVYLGPENARGTANQQVINPDYYRGIILRDTSTAGLGFYHEGGNWAMHTGLTPGWYQVQAAWLLNYDSSSNTGSPPEAFADNPRIAATPY